MARRITTGTTGSNVLGSLTTISNTLQSVVDNTNIVLDPSGTGIVESTAHVQIRNGSSLRLADNDSSTYVAIKSPATLSATYTLTMPANDGDANQALTTDGSGNLSWTTSALTISNQTADSSTYYPAMTTATSGTTSSVNTSSSKLTFQPSTGTLTSTLLSATGATITSATISGTTASTSTGTGALIVSGGLGVAGAIYAGSIQSTPIGSSNRSSGAFTSLTSDGATTFTANTASSSTGTGTLIVTGGVGISGQVTATTVVETSSIAFKENVQPIDNALDTIMKLFGVTYDRVDNQTHEAGLIAEDVYQVAPDLVSLDENGKPYGIKYTKIGAYLIEAIKSLKQEIDSLKK